MRITPLFLAVTTLLVACAPAVPEQPTPVPPSSKASLETYTDTDLGYTMEVPSDWTITTNDTVTTDDYTATGTSFVYPADHDSSALFDAKVHIAMMQTCPNLTDTRQEIVGDIEYTMSNWSGVGAGNRYEGQTFVQQRDDSCFVVTLYTHSCNLGGSDCGDDHALPGDTEGTLFKLKSVFGSMQFE